MAHDPYKEIPGWRFTVRVKDEEVGGVLVVLDTSAGSAILPDIHHPERWAILHVDGKLHSPKALYQEKLKEARDLARKIALGNSEIKLRALEKAEPAKKMVTVKRAKSGEAAGSGSSNGGVPRAREGEESATTKIETTLTPEVYYGPQDYNNRLHAAIAKRIDPDTIAEALVAMLEAEKPVYDKGVIVDNVPDQQARQFALTFAANYTVGRPLERIETTERKDIDYELIQKRMEDSPEYRMRALQILSGLSEEEMEQMQKKLK